MTPHLLSFYLFQCLIRYRKLKKIATHFVCKANHFNFINWIFYGGTHQTLIGIDWNSRFLYILILVVKHYLAASRWSGSDAIISICLITALNICVGAWNQQSDLLQKEAKKNARSTTIFRTILFECKPNKEILITCMYVVSRQMVFDRSNKGQKTKTSEYGEFGETEWIWLWPQKKENTILNEGTSIHILFHIICWIKINTMKRMICPRVWHFIWFSYINFNILTLFHNCNT